MRTTFKQRKALASSRLWMGLHRRHSSMCSVLSMMSALALLSTGRTHAFVPRTTTTTTRTFTRSSSFARTCLQSSSTNRDSTDNNKFWPLEPPPPVEDTFVMTGDLVSLFTYSITDHFVCRDMGNMLLEQTVTAQQVQAAVDSSQLSQQTAVWLDESQPTLVVAVKKVQLADHLVTAYSPLLQSTGAAAVLLCTAWLLAGYLHATFSFRHTTDCPTETVLLKTAETWITSSALLLGLVALQHAVCGCEITSMWSYFTKGDVLYILDSLTVLVLWRFLVSYMLGGRFR